MEYRSSGYTGINVTELCFGALTIGPLQSNIPIQAGCELIVKALNEGISFIDTVEPYMTYDHIRYALDRVKGETVIASKSSQKTSSKHEHEKRYRMIASLFKQRIPRHISFACCL